MKLNNKGFTLMELVVTSSIMATLAAFAVPSLLETNLRAKGTKTMDNMGTIGKAVQQRYNELQNEYALVQLDTSYYVNAGAEIDSLQPIITYRSISSPGQSITISMRDIFPSGIPLSPFQDKNYLIAVTEGGNANYTVNPDGNVDLIFTAPSMTIFDPEDVDLKLKFTF